jgi:hypothetical protein
MKWDYKDIYVDGSETRDLEQRDVLYIDKGKGIIIQ